MGRPRKNSAVNRKQTPPRMTRERQAMRIRARLDTLDWTQTRLANLIGMHPTDLNNILKTDTPHAKKRSLDAVLAWRIARALGLSPHYLLFGDTDHLSKDVLETLPREDD